MNDKQFTDVHKTAKEIMQLVTKWKTQVEKIEGIYEARQVLENKILEMKLERDRLIRVLPLSVTERILGKPRIYTLQEVKDYKMSFDFDLDPDEKCDDYNLTLNDQLILFHALGISGYYRTEERTKPNNGKKLKKEYILDWNGEAYANTYEEFLSLIVVTLCYEEDYEIEDVETLIVEEDAK